MARKIKRQKVKEKSQKQIWGLINLEIKKAKMKKKEKIEEDNLEEALIHDNIIFAYENLKDKIKPRIRSFWDR